MLKRKTRFLIRNDSFGDTIIEVMVALAILGVAFSISYTTASRAITTAQNSQEHSQALELLDSQADLLRAASSNNALFMPSSYPTQCPASNMPPGYTPPSCPYPQFCLYAGASSVQLAPTDSPICNPPLSQGSSANYHIFITYTKQPVGALVAQDIFTLTILWPGLGQQGSQQAALQSEALSYKLHLDTGLPISGGSG